MIKMTGFGWFNCGVFMSTIVIDIWLIYYNLGSINQRVLIFILSIIGIGLMLLTQKQKESNR